MPQRSESGGRLRALRLEQGVSQQKLAEIVDISASYLNLIEHNRRRIGAGLLQALAEALGVDAQQLSSGPDQELLATLQGIRPSRDEAVDQFADRFPGWADVVCRQAERIAELETQVTTMADRVSNDPELSAALHMVLSTVTSIQSSASILVDGAGDRDWEARFHQNILQDSQRLSGVSRALVAHLEQPRLEQSPLSTEQEAAAFWEAQGYAPEEIEEGQSVDLAGMSTAAQAVVAPWVDQFRADAAALPCPVFQTIARDAAYDPQVISQATGQPFATVLRRLAMLPAAPEQPEMGLVVTDITGAVRFEKPLAGMRLSGADPICSVWPVFQAVLQPGRPLRDVVTFAQADAPRLTAYAVAEVDPSVQFHQPAGITSTMLVVSDAPTEAARYVGRQCQQCLVDTCAARRVPGPGRELLSL